MVDSLFPLLQNWGLKGTLHWIDLIRRSQGMQVSPIVSVLWPEGLPSSVVLALEDRATTNIHIEPCSRHTQSRSLAMHGKCHVIRKSTSGRVQEVEDYYHINRSGKLVLQDKSCCPLDTKVATTTADEQEEEESKFLEELTAQLKLKAEGGGGASGQSTATEGPLVSTTADATQPPPALMFMEEDDPEFDDEDDDDGLDDDLDL